MQQLKSRFAQCGSVNLHYVEAGSGESIVFVHGVPEFWYAFHNQLQDFAKDYHVFAYDNRGMNLSEKPDVVDAYSAERLAEDLRHFILNVAGGKAIVVGHDWGAIAAWVAAARYPEIFAKLVIVNGPHPKRFRHIIKTNPLQMAKSWYAGVLSLKHMSRFPKAIRFAFKLALLEYGNRKGFFNAEDIACYENAWAQSGMLSSMAKYYRANMRGIPGPHKVTVDTLVIWGMRDQALVRENCEGLEEFVPNLEVVRFEKNTHWILHENPTEVNAVIREFINK